MPAFGYTTHDPRRWSRFSPYCADVTTVEQLQFTDRFVRELPGDPRSDNRTRQVRQACYSRVAADARSPRPSCSRSCPRSPRCSASTRRRRPSSPRCSPATACVPGMAPYAACYGGHQFGNWAGQLGDGRAITLGEVVNARRRDAGSCSSRAPGPTPYSRTRRRPRGAALVAARVPVQRGDAPPRRADDARAVARRAPASRSCATCSTTAIPQHEPGAVVCRVAPSFLRFGNFEIHAARDDDATAAQARRLHARARTSRSSSPARRSTYAALVRRGRAAHRVDGRRVDARRLRARRDEHRQHVDPRPHDRLRPVRLARAVRSRLDAEHHRRAGRRYRFGNQPRSRTGTSRSSRARSRRCRRLDAAARARSTRSRREFSTHYRHTMLRKLGLTGRRDTPSSDDALLDRRSASCCVDVETDITLFFRRLAEPDVERRRSRRVLRASVDADRARDRARWLARVSRARRVEGIDEAERARA